MKLSALIKPELDYLRDNGNFTEEELQIFYMLSSGKSIVYISEKMQYSTATVNRRIKKIYEKIDKINKRMC